MMDQQGTVVDQAQGTGELAVVEKVCGNCGLSKPLSEFSFKYKDSGVRLSQCKTCMTQYKRGRLAAKRHSDLASYLERIKDASDPQNFGAVSRIEAIGRAMIARFGGLDRFAEFWYQFIQYARNGGKDHLVQRSLEVLSRFIEMSDRKVQEREPDYSRMSPDELAEEVKITFVRTFFEDPELGAAILDELGWTVLPPEPSADVEPEPFLPFFKRLEERAGDRLDRVADAYR